MIRQIVKSKPGARLNSPENSDDYKDRLIKMIPTDVVAVYLACNTAVGQFKGDYNLYWYVFAIILFFTPFYLIRVLEVKDLVQIILMCISFTLWTMTIDNPFIRLFHGNVNTLKLFSTIAVALYTFAVPIFYKGK
jgi:hypothetical protein